MRKRASSGSSGSFTQRLGQWIDGLPAWARPPAFGALLIVLLAGARGLFVVGPIAVVGILVTSRTPGRDLAVVAAALGLAVLGGAAAGLAYSLVGRWLRRVPVVGGYLAGPVTVAPYMAAVAVIVRLTDGKPVWAPPDGGDRFVFGLMTLLFGLLVGYFLVRLPDDDAAATSRDPAA